MTKTNALESLTIAGFVRGLSVRDVEQTLADVLGAEAALSKSTVSRVCEAIKTEFEAWSQRRLDDLELDEPSPNLLMKPHLRPSIYTGPETPPRAPPPSSPGLAWPGTKKTKMMTVHMACRPVRAEGRGEARGEGRRPAG